MLFVSFLRLLFNLLTRCLYLNLAQIPAILGGKLVSRVKYIKAHPTKYTHSLLIINRLIMPLIIATTIAELMRWPVLSVVLELVGAVTITVGVVLLILDWRVRK